jgi:hypothetical protein
VAWRTYAAVFVPLYLLTAFGFAVTPDAWGYVVLVPVVAGAAVGITARTVLATRRKGRPPASQ